MPLDGLQPPTRVISEMRQRPNMHKRKKKQKKQKQKQTLTSFFSSGVPGIGTSALTGNDSGCSGMLSHSSGSRPIVSRYTFGSLGDFIDESNPVRVCFYYTQDAAGANADSRVADGGYRL